MHHAHEACRKKKTRRLRQQHEEQDRSVVGFCQPQPTIFTSQKTWSKKEEVGHKKQWANLHLKQHPPMVGLEYQISSQYILKNTNTTSI
jgi:hypothetical protein